MMRILVVDDEEHLRRMMRMTLEAAGYEVAEAANGEEGLREFADGLQFDVTLLDQRMPGMDGLETLRQMRGRREDAIVIMVTAYATIELAVDAMKLGATDFVRKPMTPDTLRNAVSAALAKRAHVPVTSGAGGTAVAAPAPPVLSPPEIWTTNGFYIRRVPPPAGTVDPLSTEHHFVVRRGSDSRGTDVVVTIDPFVLARVARESRRDLGPSGSYWRRQAGSALINYLWSEASVPEGGRLVLETVTARMVDEALDWKED